MSEQPIPNYSYELLASIVCTLHADLVASNATCDILTADNTTYDGACQGCKFNVHGECITYNKEFQAYILTTFPEASL